jgi:hypothetical protein
MENRPAGRAGRTGRYFKYAIGEIILVVIGILIAIQINTWNQKNKDSKEEYFILEKLRENIKTDTTNLKNSILSIQAFLEDLKIIEQEMGDESLMKFSVELSGPLLSVVGTNLETTTWENLKSTGKLGLIKNTILVDSLQAYYKKFENVNQNWVEGFQSYNRGILAPKFFEFDDLTFFAPEGSFLNEDIQRLPPVKYGDNVFFRNAVRFRIGALNSIKAVFEADLSRAIVMLNRFNSEIELKKLND